MMVADTLRRKTKITPTTSTAAISSVSCTLSTEARMLSLRSWRISRSIAGGQAGLELGQDAP